MMGRAIAVLALLISSKALGYLGEIASELPEPEQYVDEETEGVDLIGLDREFRRKDVEMEIGTFMIALMGIMIVAAWYLIV